MYVAGPDILPSGPPPSDRDSDRCPQGTAKGLLRHPDRTCFWKAGHMLPGYAGREHVSLEDSGEWKDRGSVGIDHGRLIGFVSYF